MTIILLGITIIISLIGFSNEMFQRKLIFNAYLIHHHKEWWRILSSGFIHADFMHLLFNMFVLYGFGQAVESYYNAIFGNNGGADFLILYLGAIVIANAPSLVKYKDATFYNSLGASGGVAAILFAAILFDPWSKIYLFGIIGIPGIILGPLYLFYEYRSALKANDHINHDAHFYGALFGMVFTIILNPRIVLHFVDQLINNFPL